MFVTDKQYIPLAAGNEFLNIISKFAVLNPAQGWT
jgi:hypothetical protein